MSAFARRCLLAPALPLAAVLCLTPSLSAQSGPKPRDEAAVLAAAKAIHAKVLSIDTHVDIARRTSPPPAPTTRSGCRARRWIS